MKTTRSNEGSSQSTSDTHGRNGRLIAAVNVVRTRGGAALVRSGVGRYVVGAVAVAMFIGLSIWSRAFFTGQNLVDLGNENAAITLIAIGETFVIIGGNFDLSVGAVYSLVGVVAVLFAHAFGTVPAVVLALVAGTLLGAVNGCLVVVGRVNSFVATLATQYVFYGLAIVVTGGAIIQTSAAGFGYLGNGVLLGVQMPLVVVGVIVVVTIVILHRMVFGRHILAVGSRLEAARVAGVRVNWVRVVSFAISGFTAGLAGIVDASRVSSAQGGTGTDLVLTGIAAVVIGGTSILGGSGAIWRTLIGVLILALILNGFDLLGISATWQDIVEGLLIAIAVMVDVAVRGTARGG